MSYVRKNKKNISGAIIGVVVVATIAVWQFYEFVTFRSTGLADVRDGSSHLWWAIAFTIFAFGTAFLVFLAFVSHDADDDLHITSVPHVNRISS
jgi:hypothetical protein